MSHLIKDQKDIISYINYINTIEKEGVNVSLIEEIIINMLNINDLNEFVHYNVMNDDKNPYSLEFVPKKKIINVSMQHIYYLLNMHSYVFKKEFNVKNIDRLKGYIVLQLLSHEVEHACQYSMGKKIMSCSNSVIAKSYKNLFDVIINYNKSNRNMSIVDKYLEKSDYLLIERNANIESYDLVIKCASLDEKKDIADAYKDILKSWIILGYKDNSKGSIYETYKLIGMMREYYRFNHIVFMNDEERIRYGFPILEKDRKKVLNYYK